MICKKCGAEFENTFSNNNNNDECWSCSSNQEEERRKRQKEYYKKHSDRLKEYHNNYMKENKMNIITINLPEKYLDAIQILNDCKIYQSRSEAIRVALERFLTNELKMDQEIEIDNFNLLTRRRIL